jgi:Ca2+/Na+ antiporter
MQPRQPSQLALFLFSHLMLDPAISFLILILYYFLLFCFMFFNFNLYCSAGEPDNLTGGAKVVCG